MLTVDDLTELHLAEDIGTVVPDDVSQLSEPDVEVHTSRGTVLAALFCGLLLLLAVGLPAHGKTKVSTNPPAPKTENRKITTLTPDETLSPLGELDNGLAPGEDVGALLGADGTTSAATGDGTSGSDGADGSTGGASAGSPGRAGNPGQAGQPGQPANPTAVGRRVIRWRRRSAPSGGNTGGVNRGSQNSQTGGQTNTGGQTRTGDANASGGSGDSSDNGGGSGNEATQPGQSSNDGQAHRQREGSPEPVRLT